MNNIVRSFKIIYGSHMNNRVQLTISRAEAVLFEVNSFYSACNRSTSINPEDMLVLAHLDRDLVGVVRLCFERNTCVLRTMQVRDDLQGKGLGRLILKRFRDLLGELKVDKIFCMPYAHLEYFYGLIGFQMIDPASAPIFLQERADDFHRRNPEKKVILMVR